MTQLEKIDQLIENVDRLIDQNKTLINMLEKAIKSKKK